MHFFDSFVSRYTINAEIELLTPVHVGVSSDSISPISADNAVIRLPDGNAVIPGSSLKGVFRSSLESLLRGMGVASVCDPTGNSPCSSEVNHKIPDSKAEEEETFFAGTCEVCSLFGSQAVSSHVYFSDAVRVGKGIEPFSSIRDGVMIRRDTESAARGKKYQFETVNPGTLFKAEFLIENVEAYQMGYLLIIMDMVNNGFIRIGGKKSAGLGRIRIGYSVMMLDKELLLEGESFRTLGASDLEKMKDAARVRIKEMSA